MEEDCANGMNTAPDTVTYNTVLAALGGIAPGLDGGWPSLEEAFPFVGGPSTGWSLERIVMRYWIRWCIGRFLDAITYRHAMLTSGLVGYRQ
jgi:hypothetical protein